MSGAGVRALLLDLRGDGAGSVHETSDPTGGQKDGGKQVKSLNFFI